MPQPLGSVRRSDKMPNKVMSKRASRSSRSWRSSGARLIAVGALAVLAGCGGDSGRPSLVLEDKIGDCREAGRDTGERCDTGADVETLTLSVVDGRLEAEFVFLNPPELGPETNWTMQFFIDLESEVICGLSNVPRAKNGVDDTGQTTTTAYSLDPVTKDELGPVACDASLDNATATFTIDLADQPDDAEFRLLGSIKLEFPNDTTAPGSEDDFLIRGSLDAIADSDTRTT
jgi:hypothetical protein